MKHCVIWLWRHKTWKHTWIGHCWTFIKTSVVWSQTCALCNIWLTYRPLRAKKGIINIQQCSVENQKGVININSVLLRARRALSISNSVLLRTRRVLSISNSVLLRGRALSIFNSVLLRTRRVLSISNNVLLRTRRALSSCNVHSDSVLLVLNETSLKCDNALLLLSRRYLCNFNKALLKMWWRRFASQSNTPASFYLQLHGMHTPHLQCCLLHVFPIAQKKIYSRIKITFF